MLHTKREHIYYSLILKVMQQILRGLEPISGSVRIKDASIMSARTFACIKPGTLTNKADYYYYFRLMFTERLYYISWIE